MESPNIGRSHSKTGSIQRSYVLFIQESYQVGKASYPIENAQGDVLQARDFLFICVHKIWQNRIDIQEVQTETRNMAKSELPPQAARKQDLAQSASYVPKVKAISYQNSSWSSS